MRPIVLVSALAIGSSAHAATNAGGLSLSTANLGTVGTVHGGVLPCIGGTGLTLDGPKRMGGDGTYCAGGDSRFITGGARLGRQTDVAFGYAGVDLGLGGGWLDIADDTGRMRSAFVYARPALTAGLPVGFGAVEASVYAMVPLPVVQSLAGDAAPRASFPFIGVQLTGMIGNFRDRKDRSPEPEAVGDAWSPDDAPDAVAIAPAPPPPPAPPVVDEPRGDAPGMSVDYEEDSRPLAIPGNPPAPRR